MTQHASALAGWESATMQNLGPLLGETASATLWDAIVAHREHGDADTLAAAARAVIPPSLPLVRERLERALTALPVPE